MTGTELLLPVRDKPDYRWGPAARNHRTRSAAEKPPRATPSAPALIGPTLIMQLRIVGVFLLQNFEDGTNKISRKISFPETPQPASMVLSTTRLSEAGSLTSRGRGQE